MGSEKRVKNCRVTLRFSEEELNKITKNSKQCDLGLSTYLRELGLGYMPKSNFDAQALIQLANLHGDIGRIGGLLKMWLSDQSKARYGQQLKIPDLIKNLFDLRRNQRVSTEFITVCCMNRFNGL